MASTVVGVVKQPLASSFLLPSKVQRVTHYQLNKQPSFSLPLPLPIRKHPRKISVSGALKSEGYWIPSSFDSRNLWSIRDDLELLTLAYSGPIAQGGQGPPLMLAETLSCTSIPLGVQLLQVWRYVTQYLSLPNSRIMIHQPLGGAQGQQMDIEIQANEILHHKANLNGYLAYHIGQQYETIVQDTNRDFFMSAKEAKEYGLIDAVISNSLKALQPLPEPIPA